MIDAYDLTNTVSGCSHFFQKSTIHMKMETSQLKEYPLQEQHKTMLWLLFILLRHMVMIKSGTSHN